MARIERDNYNGGYRVTGLEHDIAKARQNRQFQQDMSRIGDQVANAPGDALSGAARTTAGIAAGGVAVGVGMARNKRFRYIMQAILHFPMAFLVVFFIAFIRAVMRGTSGMTDSEVVNAMGGFLGDAAVLALVVGTVWTLAYILLRTRPKLRRLGDYR